MSNLEDNGDNADGDHSPIVDGPTGSQSGTANRGAATMPKCVCSWKNCRVYQKFFRGHPVWDGVIKLKFSTTEPESMALKASIDRNLKVPSVKAHDWKPGRDGAEITKYNVACHHWTEQHIRKYRADPKHYSFVIPFSVHGAKKYLFRVDDKETLRDPGVDGEPLYLQCPLVPKETVKNLFYQIKDDLETGVKKDVRRTGSRSKLLKDDDIGVSPQQNREHEGSSHNFKPRRPEEKDRKDSLTVSTNRSSKTSEVLLQEKEFENKRLKDQLEEMQSQIKFLHHVVSKLQEEHYDNHSARQQRAVLVTNSGHRRRTQSCSGGAADGSSRRTGSRSSRSSVPNEIEIESEDDGNWIEPAINEEWSEEDEEEEDEDDRSRGTFHHGYNQGGLKRGNSFSSRASRTSRATSIVSASKSVKSLPREIELDNDEESHQSLEQEAFDNRSFASSKKHHLGTKPRRDPKTASRRSTNSVTAKKPHRRLSVGANSSASHSNRGQSRGGNGDDSSHSGVYQVTALTVTDPYGEQGTYTGSISNSTGMPHGFGRLEYDKAGRWYEGDWKNGRWTGQGRLSNGDGDFYEGGLKSDHKHGRGVMKFADGRIFDGEYVNGQMVEGKMTYQDGSTYTGGWADGMRHGRGRCVFTDQSVYEGEFREGEFFGFGKMSWSDGGWYEGEWCNGEMQGYGKEIRPDGSLRHEGQWSKGQPIRKWKN